MVNTWDVPFIIEMLDPSKLQNSSGCANTDDTYPTGSLIM